ncbi:hypothetical protein [uncultured Erythrobacter sp.]|uniref:hypothetical protein n=1 Tax=uncultured Erythrobacter sp. TaxID=263913 RepID=UPI00262B5E2C|nr:hypothetical protein [uncultured Erythrobacter sp.]
MAIEWIKASLALKYAAHGGDEYSVRKAIIERANAGIIAAKAQKLILDETEESNRRIPLAFWRTDDLNDDLLEDWERGDFQRSDRYQIDEQAFGVSFDFLALSELVPSHLQAAAMREISLSSDQEWISARDLQQMMFTLHNSAQARSAIVEACQLGHIAGRAERMTGEDSSGSSKLDPVSRYGALAWDIPIWFWRDFIRDASTQNWSLSKVSGDGYRERRSIKIELQGVHFHRSGLINLGLEDSTEPEARQAKSGRKPTYDWLATCLAIFGEIHRGDLKPENQADIERALAPTHGFMTASNIPASS